MVWKMISLGNQIRLFAKYTFIAQILLWSSLIIFKPIVNEKDGSFRKNKSLI